MDVKAYAFVTGPYMLSRALISDIFYIVGYGNDKLLASNSYKNS
jgi:hypothetical protein